MISTGTHIQGASDHPISGAIYLPDGNGIELAADLHPSVRYRCGNLEVGKFYEELDPAALGVLLVPAVFVWPDIYVITDAPWRPTLAYGPQGVGG